MRGCCWEKFALIILHFCQQRVTRSWATVWHRTKARGWFPSAC